MSKQKLENVNQLADLIYKDLQCKDSVISQKEGEDSYTKHIPAMAEKISNLTIEGVEATHEYNEVFIPAAVEASGKIAIAAMKKDKTSKIVTGQVNMLGKDNISVVVERDKEFRVPGEEGKTMTKPVHITQTLHIEARRNTGSMGKVHGILADLAENAFK